MRLTRSGAAKMRRSGIKYPTRSRALNCDGSAQNSGVELCRYGNTCANKFKELKQRPYWGNHFWARGFCSDTIDLEAEKIRLYVLYQEKKEQQAEQSKFDF